MNIQNEYTNIQKIVEDAGNASGQGLGAPRWFSVAHTALRQVERLLAACAAAMLLTIMLVATVDVALRYLFNAPLGWSYDVISLYLMAGVFFLALAETLERHGHIAVDLLHGHLSPRARHAALLPGYVLSALVLGAIAWLAAVSAAESYASGDVIVGRFDWPTWIPGTFVALGFAVLALRVVHRIVGHVLSSLAGRSVVALPPIAGMEH